MLHFFITKNHFPRCHEVGLFGVRPSSVNQLAQVRDGDIAYVYQRSSRAFYGPYRCRGDVVYVGPTVTEPIWEWSSPGSGRERFRFVVRITPADTVYRLSAAAVYEAAREAGVKLAPEDFITRSVFTFLPAEGERMKRALAAAPAQTTMGYLTQPQPLPLNNYRPLNLYTAGFITRYETFDESLLEFLLSREKTSFAAALHGRPVFNQLRTEGRGRIDLIYAGNDQLYIIELKRERRDVEARRDILRYELWARGRRQELARALALESATPRVVPVLLARGGPARPEACLIYDWQWEPKSEDLIFNRVQ